MKATYILIPLALLLLSGCGIFQKVTDPETYYANNAKKAIKKAIDKGVEIEEIFETGQDSVMLYMPSIEVGYQATKVDTAKILEACQELNREYVDYSGWDGIQGPINNIVRYACPSTPIDTTYIVLVTSMGDTLRVPIRVRGRVVSGTVINVDAPREVKMDVKTTTIKMDLLADKPRFLKIVAIGLIITVLAYIAGFKVGRK